LYTNSNFRRDNPGAIRKVFSQTVTIAKDHDLIGGKILAGDSTKLRAQNSKKNNFSEKKIQRHIEYIDKKLEEYTSQLAGADNDNDKQEAEGQIKKHKIRRVKYEDLAKQLEKSGEAQISTSDPDSRQMIVRGNITEVVYNIQTIDNAKHNLLLNYDTTQSNDTHALSKMVEEAIPIIGHTDFLALYDKGYHTGSEIAACHEMGIETMVAIPARPVSGQAPNPAFNYESFIYDLSSDTYTCPAGHKLKTNGTIYTSKSSSFKQYKTSGCKNCASRSLCTKAKKNGRIIQRPGHIESVERNRRAVGANPEIYKRRQAIVEHPFGTIKRQWGFDHTMIKRGKNRVSADVGLICIAYNLRRLINILCPKAKDSLCFMYFYLNMIELSLFKTFKKVILGNMISNIQKLSTVKSLILAPNQLYLSKFFGGFSF
jgi:hypothetical protein